MSDIFDKIQRAKDARRLGKQLRCSHDWRVFGKFVRCIWCDAPYREPHHA